MELIPLLLPLLPSMSLRVILGPLNSYLWFFLVPMTCPILSMSWFRILMIKGEVEERKEIRPNERDERERKEEELKTNSCVMVFIV